MNNTERKLWIYNDESLYNWWQSSRQSLTAFIKAHRTEIDAHINKMLNRK